MASASIGTRTDCTANASPQPRAKRRINSARCSAWRSALSGKTALPVNQSALSVAFDKAEQNVVAPGAIDPQIGARKTLALKAVALEHPGRGDIVRNAGCFDAMQAQGREAEAHGCGDRAGHVAAARVRSANPIAERRRLRDAAPDPADRNAAEQDIRLLSENKERIGFVASNLIGLAAQAPAKSGAGQIIGRPRRLPGREKLAPLITQMRPSQKVEALRGPQIKTVAAHEGRGIGEPADAKKGHGRALRRLPGVRRRPPDQGPCRCGRSPSPSALSGAFQRRRDARPQPKDDRCAPPSLAWKAAGHRRGFAAPVAGPARPRIQARREAKPSSAPWRAGFLPRSAHEPPPPDNRSPPPSRRRRRWALFRRRTP